MGRRRRGMQLRWPREAPGLAPAPGKLAGSTRVGHLHEVARARRWAHVTRRSGRPVVPRERVRPLAAGRDRDHVGARPRATQRHEGDRDVVPLDVRVQRSRVLASRDPNASDGPPSSLPTSRLYGFPPPLPQPTRAGPTRARAGRRSPAHRAHLGIMPIYCTSNAFPSRDVAVSGIGPSIREEGVIGARGPHELSGCSPPQDGLAACVSGGR